ncbi:MAG TPA: PASTA domain-containing protein, partial [Micromonosporaceae bacterium]
QIDGETKAEAVVQLNQAGFTNLQWSDVSSSKPKGTVVGSSPQQNTTQPKSTLINVELSLGDEAKLPPLDGMTQTEAKSALSQLGFTNVHFSTGTSHSQSDVNHVVDQNPNSGQTVKLNTKITVYLGGHYSPPTNPPPSSPPPSAPPSIGPPTPNPS